MRELLDKLKEQISNRQDSVLATIISSSGSTPRSEGARMLIGKKGRICGTIGGGPVEYQSEVLAKQLLEKKHDYVKTFILAPNEIADLGMICGGNVEVHFQYLPWEKDDLCLIYQTAEKCIVENKQGWLLSILDERTSSNIGFYSEEEGLVGLKQQLLPKLKFIPGFSVVEIGQQKISMESFIPDGTVYIFGGGHVAQALVPVLKTLDFYCAVVEDRQDFLTKELFPVADKLILADYSQLSQSIKIEPNDYIIVMTRGHKFDFEVVRQLLSSVAKYIGVMGSKHKIAVQVQRLQEVGFSLQEIERINMPIGLNIKAETPAELAISISGELIEKRANRY